MDKDAQMISKMSYALIDLQVKYRGSGIVDRMQIRPSLEELLNDFAKYQIRLLKEGTITSDADLEEMIKIKKEIDDASKKQQLLAAIGKTIGFIASKII